jgi:transcriptional regulator with XRE-family HTH domain
MPTAKAELSASRVYRQGARFKREAKALGLRIRSLREAAGWTLEKCAERAELDLKHLQKIESGQLNVTLVTLSRIATGFRVPLSDLFLHPTSAEAASKSAEAKAPRRRARPGT